MMHVEAPEFKRCCFCLPLRRGLIAWGYVKLVLVLLTTVFVVAMTYINHVSMPRSFDTTEIAILTVVITSLVIDLSFDIIFIVASHKKSVKLLNVSYVYNWVCLSLVLLGSCYQQYVSLRYIDIWWRIEQLRMYIILEIIFMAGLELSLIFVQTYLLLLLRSEMTKLREQSLEMQFSNHLASGEPKCSLYNATESDQGKGKIQAVQDDCTLHIETQAHKSEGKKQVVKGQDASH